MIATYRVYKVACVGLSSFLFLGAASLHLSLFSQIWFLVSLPENTDQHLTEMVSTQTKHYHLCEGGFICRTVELDCFSFSLVVPNELPVEHICQALN